MNLFLQLKSFHWLENLDFATRRASKVARMLWAADGSVSISWALLFDRIIIGACCVAGKRTTID